VLACPPSAWYRCRKFARRNRGALVLASVVTVALVLVVAALAGGIGWAASDRAARDAALDAEVSRTLDEAERLAKEEKWPEALAAAGRAAKLLAAAGRQERPERLLQLQQDSAMALRLEEIFSHPKGEEYGNRLEGDAEYARAFRDYGIDLAVLPAAEAAERIKARSIRLELARSLDIWSGMRKSTGNPGPPDWKQLLEVAKTADPDPWRRNLREALQRSDAKALEAMAASVDVRELPPGTLHRLALALHDVGLQNQTVALLRQAQRQYPGSLWLNNELGYFYYAVLWPPQHDDALRFYAAAQALRPHNPYITHDIAMVLRRKKAYAEAVGVFSRAIDLKPDSRYAWHNRGVTYWDLGQPDKALADFSKAIEVDPNSALAWASRGRSYLALGLPDKAIADFSKAIEVAPNARSAWHAVATAYAATGQWPRAAEAYARAADRFPDDVELWCEYAGALLLTGDHEGYRRVRTDVFQRHAQATDPETCYVVARIASLAPGTADPAQAVQWAEKGVAAFPKKAWYLHTLALAHYRAEQLDQAVRRAEQSLNDDPSWPAHVVDWLVLAMAHQRLGHPADAHLWLDRARQWMDRERNKYPKGAPVIWPVPSWSDRLEIELLNREAEQLFRSEREM
jgi:tetratricopeptide (TPR) repeat protein